MTLQEQIIFMKEHARQARFEANDPSRWGKPDKALIEKANALTFALCNLEQLHELRKALKAVLAVD